MQRQLEHEQYRLLKNFVAAPASMTDVTDIVYAITITRKMNSSVTKPVFWGTLLLKLRVTGWRTSILVVRMILNLLLFHMCSGILSMVLMKMIWQLHRVRLPFFFILISDVVDDGSDGTRSLP
jgi:hypothetical protein